MVGKVTEPRAKGVVAFNEWDAYRVDTPAGHCQALEALGQDMRDDSLQELGG